MSKRHRKFQRIGEAKERYRRLSSETINRRLTSGYLLTQEARIAYPEILHERKRKQSDEGQS